MRKRRCYFSVVCCWGQEIEKQRRVQTAGRVGVGAHVEAPPGRRRVRDWADGCVPAALCPPASCDRPKPPRGNPAFQFPTFPTLLFTARVQHSIDSGIPPYSSHSSLVPPSPSPSSSHHHITISSHVEVLEAQARAVLLDEPPPRRDAVAHQQRKRVARLGGVLERQAAQQPVVCAEGGRGSCKKGCEREAGVFGRAVAHSRLPNQAGSPEPPLLLLPLFPPSHPPPTPRCPRTASPG